MTTKLNPVAKGGRVRVASATLTYAAQAAGTLAFDNPLTLPKGAYIVGGVISTSVTAGGTATVALGITGTTGKYRAAATLTNTSIAEIAIPHAAFMSALTAEENVFPTLAAAALPASGTMQVVIYYVKD